VDQRKRREGRFFGRRVNCECVPSMPAWIVGQVLDDPRKIPYLLVWTSRNNGTVREAVRVASYSEPPGPFADDWTGWVEVKRTDETRSLIHAVRRPLPRNGGKSRFLICPVCQIPRRSLFGWEVDYWGRYTTSARTCPWRCRSCAGLRYESEGGALVHRARGTIARLFEMYGGPLRSPRTEPWYPYVFTSPQQAADAGLCNLAG
jgi:hypothetical protein